MKRTSLLLLYFYFLSSFAQTPADTLFYHNGTKEAAHISKITIRSLNFIYDNEITERTVGYPALKKVKYRSGREEFLSPVHSATGADQWRNVIILNSEEEVAGLVPYQTIEMHTRFINFHTSTSGERKLMRKIRQEAARLNCPFIFLTREIEVKYGKIKFWGLSQHKIRVTAYRYK